MRLPTLALSVLLFGAAPGFGQEDRAEPPADATEETWPGELVDWACKEKDPEPPCPVSGQTQEFGLVIDGGRILELDDAGDKLAREALRESGAAGNVSAVAVGVRERNLLRVSEFRLE